MKLSGGDDKLSGLGLVGPADVHAGVMAPRVPNHQVRCEDNHISGNWLPICSKKGKTKHVRAAWNWKPMVLGKNERFTSLLCRLVAAETDTKVEEAAESGCDLNSNPQNNCAVL